MHCPNLRQIERQVYTFLWLALFCLLPFTARTSYAQQDAGAITGVVQDKAGAIVPGADVTLTNTDTGLVLNAKSNGSGIYTFSPIRIGNYTVSATSPGFQTTTQQNIHIDLQERLSVPLTLTPGAVAQTVTVTTAPPLLQTQSGSVGQVISTHYLKSVPLSSQNWVYIAQLATGVEPNPGNRVNGTGGYNANGQNSSQNNFILDGVDNNVNVVDFANGSSYVALPPPDALAEFKIQTSNYSAEFGHSAGSVMNVSIKSGTNQIHGDAWEYFRNQVMDATDFGTKVKPTFDQNQFGATLGFPIIKNHLFVFGDGQGNRVKFAQPTTETVPTAKMRNGDFSELLNTSLTGASQPIVLYQPNSGGTKLLTCNGRQNVFCPNQINSIAQNLLKLYPQPNEGNGVTFNNYFINRLSTLDTTQWDAHMDWNASDKDQSFFRYSVWNNPQFFPPPLGSILDGGTFGNDGYTQDFGANAALSETHTFNPNLTNEFRFGYNYMHDSYLPVLSGVNVAGNEGLGGIPTGAGFPLNGGLPLTGIGGISSFGVPGFIPSDEYENVYEILDNVTKIVGNHSLRMGVQFQSIRFSSLQPPWPKGNYSFNGEYTSDLGASFTGFGVADFLANQMNFAQLSNEFKNGDSRWYRAAYFEDDWRESDKLTINLGLRYDFFQPYKDVGGYQATYYTTAVSTLSSTGVPHGAAIYAIPNQQRNFPLAPSFTSLLASNNISLQYSGNPALVSAQKLNFAPRVGFAYSINPKTVIHGGYGIFYGGLESVGYYPNLGENYPFQFTDTFNAPNCAANNCPSISAPPGSTPETTYGINLENGFQHALSAGLQNFISTPALRGSDPLIHTPYTVDYNLAVQRQLTTDMVASLAYVGDTSRHLQMFPDPNNPLALENPSNNAQFVRPFPGFGGTAYNAYGGTSAYNSLQAKIQKRYANGMNFLVTYTWSHSLDDTPSPLGTTGGGGFRNTNLLPVQYDYSNSAFDVRNRVTFNGYYDLPFGKNRRWMNQNRVLGAVAGDWAANLEFFAQTGNAVSVYPNISTASGGGAFAEVTGDPYASGGTPNPTNPSVTCATRARTIFHWWNPCAFSNPLPGTNIPATGPGRFVTNQQQVLAYLGGKRNEVYGPGYETINMSVFKDFPIIKGQVFEFRVDGFNILNTPDYAEPSTDNINTNMGQITNARSFQNLTPDARFFQLSGKYTF